MPMRTRTTGFREMSAEMDALRLTATGEATRKGVRAAANVMLVAMQERAPILDEKTAGSTALDPGAVKADLNIKMERVDRHGFLRAWVGPHLYSHVAYWVEYGHRLVKGGYNSLKRGKFQGTGTLIGDVPEHPFLRPAFEASERPAWEAYLLELKSQLRKWIS